MKIELLIQKQINDIIQKLVYEGICDDQNYAILKYTTESLMDVTFPEASNLAVSLKNIEYDEIYKELSKNKQYHIKMADGNLLQLLYRIEGEKIISHRLTMFPSRNLELYQNEPDLYEQDCIYADILKKNIVTFPLRFDYDYKPIDNHPKCHLSIGQYKNCRIPVFGPIMPKVFVGFIMKNFYNSFYCENSLHDFFKEGEKHELIYTIRNKEKYEMHLNLL